MLGLRLVLLDALSRVGQAALELRRLQDGARQGAPAATEDEELLLLRRLSSSCQLDAGKLTRIAERLCGLRGLDGGVEREAETERGSDRGGGGGGGGAGETDDDSKEVPLFSGASAVRWLMRSGLASGRLSAALLCRGLLSSSLILNARGGRRGFFCSGQLLYRFPAALLWDDSVTPADIARLALDTQPHLDIIAAMCAHHNAREQRRQQADEQQQQHAALAASFPSSSPPCRRSSVHRSCVLPEGQFLGCELVRWLRRRSLIACTRDGLIWGNYLLQQRWIAAEREGEEELGAAGPATAAEAERLRRQRTAGFRYAALRYSLLPTAAAKAAQQQQQRLAARQAEAAADAPSRGLLSAAATQMPAAAAVQLEAEALLTLAELQPESASGSGHDSAAPLSSSWSPAGSDCVCCLPSSPSTGCWEFVQSFGEEAAAASGETDDGAEAEDLVTAVTFSPCGGMLAIGDKAGRVSIVEQQQQADAGLSGGQALEYRFYTEFQSHHPGFDSLKSCEVSARIGCIEWWPYSTASMRLLTANDKTVKLWRLDSRETHARKQRSRADRPPAPALCPPARPALRSHSRSRSASTADCDSGSDIGDGQAALDSESEDGELGLPSASCSAVRVFSDLHAFSIHSVSASVDGCSFLSADDLRVLLFDVEHAEAAVCVMDVAAAASASASASAPAAPETGVDELLTVARFHPTDAALLCVGSSNGCLRLADLRMRHSWDGTAAQQLSAAASPALDDATAAWWSSSAAAGSSGSFCSVPSAFRAITDSVLDARWCGPHCLLVRDYLYLRCWDRRRVSHPLYVSCVHPQLLPLLPQLLQADALFDSFQCAASPSGNELLTGSYSNCFTLHSRNTQRTLVVQAADDVRETRAVAAFRNPQLRDLLAALPSPPAAGLPASVARCWMPPVDVASASPSCPLQLQQRVLKVAWHPRLQAVAVASLYKLYLYQHHTSDH